MYAGNSVIVNIFMRWPVLIPIAAAAGIAVAIPKDEPPPPVPVVVVKPVAETPVKLKAVESLCPPIDKTRKLSKKDKKKLVDIGCKVKG